MARGLMTSITDPETYNTRSILLLSQLLHINGIKTRDKLVTTPEDTISDILTQWKNHPSSKLANLHIKLNTVSQLIELYGNLLGRYNVGNTVELANAVYFDRIEELEGDISRYKQEFQEILQE
ncbi:hypothetical protein JA1_001639 [Spathaspora sp. JA1]|nr:hypothetical protein JA1_001639 [Spathaspora sp. JA1]